MRPAPLAVLVLGFLTLPHPTRGMGPAAPVACPGDLAAATEAACPCDGIEKADGSFAPWRSHGQYVRCVARLRNGLRKAGCLSDDEKRGMVRCASRSTCGKAVAVVCCLTDYGACDDPESGDETPEGVCSNDSSIACDVDDDCTRTRARLTRDEDVCLDLDGDPLTGSVCTACVD